MLRPIFKIMESKAFMKSVIADFVQFFRAIAKLLFSEQRLGSKLCQRSVLRFS